MYIKIKGDLDNSKKYAIESALKKVGIDYDVFDCPLDVFTNEESKYRLASWEEANGMELIDEDKRSEIEKEIAIKLYSANSIIDTEYVDDLTVDVIKDYLSFYKNKCDM